MLPKELLVTRKRKGTITPCYLFDTRLAERLIHVFQQYQGKKYKELLGKVEDLEGKNFRLVRGLATLLERKSEFQPSSPLSGKDVRGFLFDHGFVTNQRERKRVLQKAAEYFQVTDKEIEEALFSDLPEEQTLTKFNTVSPEELMKQYNLSLTQTLLFDALELMFQTKGNYQRVFRRIKYLGLMYEINEGVKVTGPASLFKKNRKYGTSLAKLLPEIVSSPEWTIQAKLEIRVGNEPRIMNFDFTSQDNVPLPSCAESLDHFDSEAESRFYTDFTGLNLGWEVVREPDIVKAGSSVVIPDFGFYKNGLEHYVEVMGFWTPEYLKKKIAKLKQAEANITVVVNEGLNCKKEDFLGEVIFYKNKIPVMPIVRMLKKLEEEQIDKQLRDLKDITITEDVVSLQEKAAELNVNPKTLLSVDIPNYRVIGEQLVSEKLLKQVAEEIRPQQDYKEVEVILEKNRLTTGALEVMGYKVIWEGLNPIKVVEKDNRSEVQ